MEKKRYELLDSLRGMTLCSMILYHAVWDMVYIFGVNWVWFRSDAAYVWQQSICWTFILLSGFCFSLGKRKLRRGLIVFGAGLLVSLVTVLFMPEEMVLYGVLTFLGTAMLLMLILEPLCRKGNPIIGLIVTAALFVLSREVNNGYLGFEGWKIGKLPEAWYADMTTTFLGFPMHGFFSTDYFSVVPWFFLFQVGYFGYRLMDEKGKMTLLQRGKIPVLGFCGKQSLWIYMVHQPVVYGILYLAFKRW